MDKAAFQQAKRWMFQDIDREISLTRASNSAEGRETLKRIGVSPGGGNFLAALGLLCYTEVGGKLRYNKRNSAAFNPFFDDLGPGYKSLRQHHRVNVYNIFRCGLAHEYYVKQRCTIATLSSGEAAGIVSRP